MHWIQMLLPVFLVMAMPPALCLGTGVPDSGDHPEQIVVDANNAFALALLEQLKDREANTFVSPFSISTALAMTLAGAAGETRAQMASALRLLEGAKDLHPGYRALIARLEESKDEKKCLLRIANALWGQADYAFLGDFLSLVQKHYLAEVCAVDFIHEAEAARKTINRWVEDRTEEKIKDLIQPGMLGPRTRLVLTNAVYFKGLWEKTFDAKKTREDDFTLEDGRKVRVPLMRMKDDFNFYEGEGFQALELPYQDGKLSMVVLLPAAAGGLAALEKPLTSKNLVKCLEHLRKEEVEVAFPRFKTAFEIELTPALRALGMVDPFFPAAADFSGMTGKRDLFLSNVVHKAFVEVNEEGTEAAAATGAVMTLTAIRQPRVFRADHPFLFFIRDCEKGTILFMGRLVNPQK